MPTRIPRQQREDLPLHIRLRPLARRLEQRRLVRLVDHVQRDQHVRERQRLIPRAVHLTQRRLPQTAPVRQRTLPQHLDLATRVVRLRRQKQLHLVEAVGDLLQPAPDDLLLHQAVVAVHRADLADRALQILRQLRQPRRPVQLRRRRPAIPNRVLVEVHRVLRPHLRLVENAVARRNQLPRRHRPPRRVVRQLPLVRHHPVGVDVDVPQQQPLRARRRLHPRLRRRAEDVHRRLRERILRITLQKIDPLVHPLAGHLPVRQVLHLRVRRCRAFQTLDQLIRPASRPRPHLRARRKLHLSLQSDPARRSEVPHLWVYGSPTLESGKLPESRRAL